MKTNDGETGWIERAERNRAGWRGLKKEGYDDEE